MNPNIIIIKIKKYTKINSVTKKGFRFLEKGMLFSSLFRSIYFKSYFFFTIWLEEFITPVLFLLRFWFKTFSNNILFDSVELL